MKGKETSSRTRFPFDVVNRELHDARDFCVVFCSFWLEICPRMLSLSFYSFSSSSIWTRVSRGSSFPWKTTEGAAPSSTPRFREEWDICSAPISLTPHTKSSSSSSSSSSPLDLCPRPIVVAGSCPSPSLTRTSTLPYPILLFSKTLDLTYYSMHLPTILIPYQMMMSFWTS